MDDSDPRDDAALGRLLVDSRQLQSAPAALVQRMVALAAAPTSAAAVGLADTWRRWLQAVLAFDSWSPAPGLALDAVRATASDARQLLYSAGDVDVDLRLRRVGGAGVEAWSVSGQVLGPAGDGRIVVRCGRFEAAATWNRQGEFRVEPVPPGDCTVTVEAAAWATELPPFALPALAGRGDG